MYNMEIYCTRPYCIENPYWTPHLRRLVHYGFSIQYRLVQYLSILYITLYNNLLILYVSDSVLQCNKHNSYWYGVQYQDRQTALGSWYGPVENDIDLASGSGNIISTGPFHDHWAVCISCYYILSSNKGIFAWPIWPEVNCPYLHIPGK